MKIGKYQTQFWKALKYRLFPANYPPNSWYYPTDNWVSNPQEIIRALRLDNDIGVTDLQPSDSNSETKRANAPKGQS